MPEFLNPDILRDFDTMDTVIKADGLDNVNIDSLNERLGLDGESKIRYDGEWKMGETTKIEDIKKELQESESAIKNSYDTSNGNVEPSTVERAKSRFEDSKQSLRNSLLNDDKTTLDQKKMTTFLKNDTLQNALKKFGKYLILSGLAYGALAAVATKQTGCFFTGTDNTGRTISIKATGCPVSKDKDGNNTCTLNDPNNSGCQSNASTTCLQFCPSPNFDCGGDSNCAVSNNTPNTCTCSVSGVVLTLVYQSKDAFDVLGDIFTQAGLWIEDIGNGAINVLNAAEGALSSFLKVLPYIGYAAGGALVLGLLIWIILTAVRKSKQKKAPAALGGGGRRGYKDWVKLRRKVARSKHNGQLTMLDAVVSLHY